MNSSGGGPSQNFTPTSLESTPGATSTATAPARLPWTDAAHPLWSWLLAGCAVATAAPLWCAEYLPFTDLPQHAAAIATLRHFWDPAWKSQQYFTLALGQTQYLLYYAAGAALAFPLGTAERANLALLSTIALALPYSLRALLRALRVDPRLALFGCTLFWCQALLIGLFSYLAAMPLLLYGLSLAVKNAEQPTPRRTLGLAALAVALFYLHLSAFLFFAPAAVLASLVLSRERHALQFGWLAPVGALLLFWLVSSPVVHPGAVGWKDPIVVQFEDPATALRHLPDALLDIWRGPEDEWCLLALCASAALIAWPQARAPEPATQARRRGLVALWLCLAAALYFAFPVSIGWLWQLNERYALVFALLAPLLLRPAAGWRGAAPLFLAAAAALFAAGNAAAQIRAFAAEVGPFSEVLAHAQPGRRLLALIFEHNSKHARFSPFLHFGSYYRARMGGVASFSFAELPQSPLRYRPETAPPEKPAGWEWQPYGFRNDIEGPYYDYVLVRGPVDPFGSHLAGPGWRLLAREGSWVLYAKSEVSR